MRDGKGSFCTKIYGKIYDGDWKNDVYHGHGEYYDHIQDKMVEGFWQNGQLNQYVQNHMKTGRSRKTARSGKTTISMD